MDPNIPIDRQDIADIPIEDEEFCDFCQEPIKEDEEERHITAGDESLTLCESCGAKYD